MKLRIIFFQCILCIILACTYILIRHKSQNKALQVSSFGRSNTFNDTFEELSEKLYGEHFYD